MSRIRSIKPEILTDGKAVKLSDAAWRLWVSTWLLADDTGRFPADPIVLAGQIFPGREFTEAARALSEAANAGFVRLYEVNGEQYGLITGWQKHQKINRPSGPKFPEPCDGFTEPSLSPHVDHSADRDRDRDRDHDLVSSGSPSPAADPEIEKSKASKPKAKRSKLTAAEREVIPIAEVVLGKLEEWTGRKYQPDSKATLALIVARMADGATEQDLRLVVWDRGNRWVDDPKMGDYLRPSTLFCLKHFEEYLTAARVADNQERAKRGEADQPLGSVLQGMAAQS